MKKALLIIVFVLLSGCRENDPSVDKVQIGLIPYTLDEYAPRVGTPTVQAASLAVNEINERGGVLVGNVRRPVELVSRGIASSPQNAVAAARKLINHDLVSAFVGPQFSVDAIPAGAIAERAQVPMISPMSTHRLTTAGRRYVFRASFLDDQQGTVMARFAFRDLASWRAIVLYDRTDPYSAGIAEIFSRAFADLGGDIVLSLSFADREKDYREICEAIARVDADILYLPNFTGDVLQQVMALRSDGVKLTLLGADGWNVGTLSSLKEFSGSYLTTHWTPRIDNAASDTFVEVYHRHFGAEPEAVAALTYDAMKILFRAIEEAGSLDGDRIRQALQSLGPVEGVTGTIDFVGSGDPVKGVVILRLAAGQAMFERIVYDGGEDR